MNPLKIILFILFISVISSCAPVLKQDISRTARIDVPFSDIKKYPNFHIGKVYLLGGIIADTKLTERGSIIELIYIPVDSLGYLKETIPSNGRFLAIYPKERGILDPMIYKKGRKITMAGEFLELERGIIDRMEYIYPVFEIKEIYLWEEKKRIYYIPYYPYYYPYPYWWYDPWWRYYPLH